MSTQSPQALIVDDDLMSIKVLESLLRQDGWSVASVSDPQDLAATLPELRAPQVVFLDLEMPHMDGYEVLKYLRATLGETVRVAAYTVHTSELTTVIEQGFDGMFGKPLDSKAFRANLQRLVKGERVWGR